MYLKDRGKWEKEKGWDWESGSININLSLLQLLESQYRDTHELIAAMEGMLTLTCKQAGNQRAGENQHVKTEASLKKCKMVVLVFQHHNPKTAKNLSPTDTAEAVPIYKDRYNRHCWSPPTHGAELELATVYRNSLTQQHWFKCWWFKDPS